MSRWQQFDVMGREARSIPSEAGVYVIYIGGRLVYVGQSVNVRSRIAGHRFRYGYGRNIHTPWMEVADTTPVTVKVKRSRRLGDWAMWEIRLIARLRPECNTHHLGRRAA